MQAYDSEDVVLRSMQGGIDELLEEKEKEIQKPEVARVVIGDMPEVGSQFFIGDLLFVVTGLKSRGRIMAKLAGNWNK